MDAAIIKIFQLLPPVLVVLVLIFAFLTFYKLYVVKAKELAVNLSWIKDTVLTMRTGESHVRKSGLSKVFDGSMLGESWREFQRSLHEQLPVAGGEDAPPQYRITVPAHHFFTTATVIDKPLRVNYFRHLPGILTGVGIIGTFAGLLFGLSNFDAGSPEKITKSVDILLSGVRDAFIASSLAITAAMVVTHIEKLLYQRCLTNLEDLNEAINNMFDAGVHEEYLATIARGSGDPADLARLVAAEVGASINPLIKVISDSQIKLGDAISEVLVKNMNTSNVRLAAQIESALQRQVRQPLDGLIQKMSREAGGSASNSHPDNAGSERLKKLIRAQKDSNSTDSMNKPEVA